MVTCSCQGRERGVRAAAGVMVGEAGGYVVRMADTVVGCWIGTLQNVDESLVFGHPKRQGNVDAETLEHRTRRNDEFAPHRWLFLRSE